jgi:hypothetical protein
MSATGPDIDAGFPIMSQVVSSTTATSITSAAFSVPDHRMVVVFGSWGNRSSQTLFGSSPSLVWVGGTPSGATDFQEYHLADAGLPWTGRARIRVWYATNVNALSNVQVRMDVPDHAGDPASGQLVVWCLHDGYQQGGVLALSDYSGAAGPLHGNLAAQFAASLGLWQASLGGNVAFAGGPRTGNTADFTTSNVGSSPASGYQHFAGHLNARTSAPGSYDVGMNTDASTLTLLAAIEVRLSLFMATSMAVEDEGVLLRRRALAYSQTFTPIRVSTRSASLQMDAIVSPVAAGAIRGVVPIARPGASALTTLFDGYATTEPVGPDLDPGWPVAGAVRGAPVSAMAIAAPATAGRGRLLVLAVSGRGSSSPFPVTVSGLGLTWARVGGQADGTPGNYCADIWAAWAGAQTTAGNVTVSFQNAVAKTVQATLYAYSGTAGGSPSVAACFGASVGARYTGGGTGARTLSLATQRTRSAVVYAIAQGSAAGLGEAPFCSSDTTVTDNTVPSTLVAGRYAGASGSVLSIGADGTSGDYFLQAFEIFSFNQPGIEVADITSRYPARLPFRWAGPVEFIAPTMPPPLSEMGFFHGPDRWLRPWNPERSALSWPVPPVARVIPDAPASPTLPDRPRYPWNPDRSWHVRPTVPAQDVIIPRSPVPPSLPDRNARPIPPPLWRGFTEWYPYTPAPAPALSCFLGPERPRLAWRPEQTAAAIVAGPAQLLVVVPTAPVPPSLPQRLRPAWNPERSSVVYPTQDIPVVAPDMPPPMMAPTFYMRPAWNPERSATSFPTSMGVVAPYAVLSGPSDVRVHVGFHCSLDIFNPTRTRLYVVTIQTYFEDPEQSGSLGRPSLPNVKLFNPWAVVQIPPGGRAHIEWDAVLFEDGPALIHGDVYICDRLVEVLLRRPDSALRPAPVRVFARRIGE